MKKNILIKYFLIIFPIIIFGCQGEELKAPEITTEFNSNLDKTFVKELSSKLLQWTNKRWIIAFSKKNGSPTLKEQKKNLKTDMLKRESTSEISKEVKKIFADAELISIDEES